VPDLGDGINLDHYVYDRSGTLTAATVTWAITRPDGSTFPAPGVTSPSTGYYRADTFVPDVSGDWTFTVDVSGAVTDVAHGGFTITEPGLFVPLGGPYATLPQLKAQMGIADSNTTRDAEFLRRLISASADINAHTHRQFGRADAATARTYYAGRSGVDVDDFWTDDDLAVSTTSSGSAWDMSSVDLEPLNGVVNGVPGWPYNRIVSGYSDHPLWQAVNWRGVKVTVTAKWGWAAVPGNVVTACLMLAVADDKAKDAPFGVAGFGDYAVRIRQNPMVEEKLRDYVVDPVKVAS
jgi:hypothetical protein